MNKSTQAELSEAQHRQIITALPWYVNGTLTDHAEHQRITLHLEQCASCKAEVAHLQKLESAIQQQAPQSNWQPNQAHLQTIFNRIDQAEQTMQPANDESISIWQKIRSGFDMIFEAPSAIRWTVAAQSALVVVLSVIVVTLMPDNKTETYFETYSTEKATVSNQPQIRAVFSKEMPLKALTGLLSAHTATIVDGPSTRGVVTIQFKADNVDTHAILAALRQNKYVEFAELID